MPMRQISGEFATRIKAKLGLNKITWIDTKIPESNQYFINIYLKRIGTIKDPTNFIVNKIERKTFIIMSGHLH